MKTNNKVRKNIINKDDLVFKSLIKENTLVLFTDGNILNKYKFINLVTTLDRVGKLESIFIVGYSINSKGSNYQTMYLDKAIEEYNKINIS